MRSRCSARRIVLGVAVIATMVLSVPGPAVAATECGLLVCADAESDAGWSCEVFSSGSFGFALCNGFGSGTGGGHSDLAIPGSAVFSTTIECTVHTASGLFPCGGAADGPNLCTWAGLGENACGRSFSRGGFGPFGFGLGPGECVSDALTAMAFDVEITTSTDSEASKSLLILGPLETVTATETTTALLSALPDDASTCVPA